MYFRRIYQDETEIPIEMFGEYKWGEEFQISKISYEDGTRSFKFGDDTRNNLWINQNNMYIVDKEQVQNIYNSINGLTANSFEGKTVIDPAIDIGDKIIIDGKPVIYQGEMTLEGRFIAQISSKIQIKQKQETTIKKESQKVINRRVQSEINQIEGKITQLAQETTENTEKLSKHEQSISGITDIVSNVETKVETVEDKVDNAVATADSANTTANEAKSTADTAKNDLSNNYYTKTQTESQINQKAESITSSVSKEISTAKEEAINNSNADTDEKLKEYTETEKLGTFIEQNYEHIKYAWNQISEFIQMMVLNENASLAILDDNNNILMSLDKKGQHFFDDSQNIFGEMGVQTVEDNNYIAFSVESDYDTNTQNGMAWGIKTKKDNKFHPLLFIRNFNIGPENSDASLGELELNSCNLVLNGLGTGIKTGGVFIMGDPTGLALSFLDEQTETNLLTIYPLSFFGEASLRLLDNITFYKNQAGSNSFRIGNDENNCCLFTDDGHITARSIYCDNFPGFIDEDISYISGSKDDYISLLFKSGGYVYVYANNSDKNLKKNIQETKINALDIINKIRHVEFDWKDNDKHNDIGYIAQEMKEINENFVHYQKIDLKDGTQKENWQINTLSVLATATKAIQEQQKEIQNLQLKDKEKDELIQSLIKRIETLEEGVNK